MKLRLTTLAMIALLSACSSKGEFADGGVYVVRSACPQVAIPAATGDITLFDPVGQSDAAAIDVVAAITNIRATCTDDTSNVVSTASFDVIANRRDAGTARQVILPYFDVAMRGGNMVIAKRVGQVVLNFAAGSQRAQTSGQATIRVSRAAATLPAEIQNQLTRVRKAGDSDAAIDPMTDPTVRAAVTRATFEQLIGFQLTAAQLQYNATR